MGGVLQHGNSKVNMKVQIIGQRVAEFCGELGLN